MKLYNLKDHNEQVSFAQAVTQGLGKNQGLFFPHDLPEFNLTEVDEMLNQDFVSRSAKILSAFIGDEIPQEILEERVRAASQAPARRCLRYAISRKPRSASRTGWARIICRIRKALFIFAGWTRRAHGYWDNQ